MHEGERGDLMYFVNKGEVVVFTKDLKTEMFQAGKVLKDGDMFGEVALLTKLKRTANVVCEDYSYCACLDQNDINQINEHFPNIFNQFRSHMANY